MRKKLVSVLCYAASVSLPLLSGTAFARHAHPRTFPLSPPELIAQTNPPATLEQVATHDAIGADWKLRLIYLLCGMAFGALVGTFLSDRLRRFRRVLLLTLLAAILAASVLINDHLAFGIGAGVTGLIAYRLLRDKPTGIEPIFGNAHPATRDEISRAGHMPFFDPASRTYKGGDGIPLGSFIEASI